MVIITNPSILKRHLCEQVVHIHKFRILNDHTETLNYHLPLCRFTLRSVVKVIEEMKLYL